jgi:hypothetical protein
MANAIGENHARRKLAAGELVSCMGVNQMRTPNVAMIAAACGFDAIYIDLGKPPRSRRPQRSRRGTRRRHPDRR